MRSLTQIIVQSIAVVILLPSVVAAEIYSAPAHVRDPAQPTKRGEADTSLPFIYIEPHAPCFDKSERQLVTLYAVNRSGKPLNVEWSAIVEALSLEAIGPGCAKPWLPRQPFGSVEIQDTSFTTLILNLKKHFDLKWASVYRMSYARPLSDGRIHVATPVSFVVEDASAIEKLAEGIEAGAVRDTITELLKCNPLFANGVGPKTYGWDEQLWSQLEMRRIQWQANLAQVTARWQEGIERLTVKDGPAATVRALESLIDRVLFLSDNLRMPPDNRLFLQLDSALNKELRSDEDEGIYLKLAGSRDTYVVSRSINRLMSLESEAAVDLLLSIADGPDKELANEAIGTLGNYRRDPKIIQFLRRKMTDSDGELALEAAIITCYSGDWSGFPVLLRCARSDDPALRMSAIAQLVDHKFQRYSDKVVPLLLAELKQPLSDAHLDRAIESLQTYPTADVVEAVTPLLKHENERVSRRARLTLDTILRERKRNLKNRQDVPLTPPEG